MLRCDAEAAIAMAVPVDADVDAQLGDQRFTNVTTARAPFGRRVADRVGDAQPRRAGADRRREQAAQRLGIGARRVLGDVHHVERLP